MTVFDDIRARLARLPAVNARVAQRAAPALSAIAREHYDAGESVYGDPFGVGSQGTPIDLKESGSLRAKALQYEAIGTKVRASVGAVKHARYQLKHGILPRPGQLPQEMQTAIAEIAEDELHRAMEGR